LRGKIVCQRQASQPSFENLPDTGNTISSLLTEMPFAGIHFPRMLQKWEVVSAAEGENEGTRRGKVHTGY
jgi:hypothetical protein